MSDNERRYKNISELPLMERVQLEPWCTTYWSPRIMSDDSFSFMSGNGVMLGKEDSLAIIKGLIKFYTSRTDEDIEQYNDYQYKKLNREAYGENYETVIATNRESKQKEVKKTKQNKPGYVYFIQEKATYTIKIGKATSVPDRSKIFAVKLPFEWDFVSIYKATCMDTLEKDLHKYFDKKRVNGEWFDLNEKDLDKIKQNSFPKKVKELVEKIF